MFAALCVRRLLITMRLLESLNKHVVYGEKVRSTALCRTRRLREATGISAVDHAHAKQERRLATGVLVSCHVVVCVKMGNCSDRSRWCRVPQPLRVIDVLFHPELLGHPELAVLSFEKRNMNSIEGLCS